MVSNEVTNRIGVSVLSVERGASNFEIQSEHGVVAAPEAGRLSEKHGKDFFDCDDLAGIMQTKDILNGYNDLLTVADLSAIFRTSKQTIYKELRGGKFGKPIQIGRSFLIPKIHILRKYFA